MHMDMKVKMINFALWWSLNWQNNLGIYYVQYYKNGIHNFVVFKKNVWINVLNTVSGYLLGVCKYYNTIIINKILSIY